MKRKTEHFTYELIRAKRRSMSLKVDLDGTITVRAPYRTSVQTADWFVEGHRDWIEVRLKAGARIMAERPAYTDKERADSSKVGSIRSSAPQTWINTNGKRYITSTALIPW